MIVLTGEIKNLKSEKELAGLRKGAEDLFEGGYRKEGLERPADPVVCVRCQWVQRNASMVEPERDPGTWCVGCLLGEELGHMPLGGIPDVDPVRQDTAFF